MLRLSAFAVASLLLVQPASRAATPADEAMAANLDALIAPLFKADAPGAAVIVTRDGVPLLRKAYGLADVGKGTAMTADMRLRIGSITKQFTAAAILLLAEEGRLAVGDDITKFLPDYPARGRRITLAHLLNHTSGIPNYTNGAWFYLTSGTDKTIPQVIDSFKDEPLAFEPGTRYAYTNSGYFLLGAVIEKVSGQPYARFLEQRFFAPLGMTGTSYDGQGRAAGAAAVGHAQGLFGFGGRFRETTAMSGSRSFAAGALVSTVDDMARWDAALAAGKVLKPASLQQAWSAQPLASGLSTGYGYGWQVGKLRGVPVVSHGGLVPGFASYALRLPQQKLYVAVLSNADAGIAWPEAVAYRAAAMALGQPFPEPKAVKLDQAALDACAGVYQSAGMVTRSFRRDKDKLVMERDGRKTVLTPYAEHAFYIDNSVNRVEFARDAKGQVAQATMFVADEPTVHKRIDGATR